MKAGDMVLQSEFVADWARDKSLVFIGDGDSISVCIAYLMARGIVEYGPKEIRVLDFDERIVSAIDRFADKEGIDNLGAELYNCLDALPRELDFDAFYTNPPWGASNCGESVKLFSQRGMEAINFCGVGLIVIADDPELVWPSEVLAEVQKFAIESGFFVSKMMPRLHSYHLDDNPDLRSCNLLIKSRKRDSSPFTTEADIGAERLANFYGSGVRPTVRFVREKKRLEYGLAHDDEYELEMFEEVE